jgi:hypothetical protein
MAQKLYTKQFGELDVERSWSEGAFHIALLTNGAYTHITGQPVTSKEEFRFAGLTGEELVKAEDWFEHRHDEPVGAPKKIMFEADGTPMFTDGTPVESASDLVASLQPGPILDAALLALAKAKDARAKVEASKTTKAGKAAVAAKKKTKAPPKAAKTATPGPGSAGEASITV